MTAKNEVYSGNHETINTSAEVLRGAHYPPSVLSIYDIVVLKISNPLVWRCPTPLLLSEFRREATCNHLDVGVATGYYLRHGLPRNARRIGLVDLSADSLLAARRALPSSTPTEVYRRNVLEPLALNCEPFSSASMNYLLHCLPGSLRQKSVAISHVLEWLEPGGVLFGSTILTHGVPCSRLAQGLMSLYNRSGIFNNINDTLDDLRWALAKNLEHFKLETHGCVALFSGKKT